MRSLIPLFALAALVAPASLFAQEETDAQALFVDEHKCNVCHSVAAVEIEHKSDKTAGPDLGGYATDDFESLARFLRKEEARDDEDHKKTFKGSDEELQAILDWLATLEPAES